jgi:glyceraldehyde 3-phosphate dehydrogenase
MKVAINGFGRIGRQILRAVLEYDRGEVEVMAVNDLVEPDTLAHLLKYDSVYGTLEDEVSVDGDILIAGGRKIKCLSAKDPAELPWGEMGIDVAVESTGIFTKREDAGKHIEAGSAKVLVTAPMKGKGADMTIVLGVNHEKYDPEEHNIVSNASCTTNGLAPICKIMHDNFVITGGFMTTIHAYTNGQNLVDGPNKDLRRARAAASNLVPTTTGAASALGDVIPDLEGKLDGMAVRVPVPVGSLIDLVVDIEKDAGLDDIKKTFRDSAEMDRYNGIVEYRSDPIVSTDIVGNPYSAIFDSLAAMKLGNRVKLMSWYDNEWGYSCRCYDLIKFMV